MSSGSGPAVTGAAWLAGWRGRATAGAVRAAVSRGRGLRAEALLLDHHRRRGHHVLVPVPSPASPLPLALHLLHADTAAEQGKNTAVALLS